MMSRSFLDVDVSAATISAWIGLSAWATHAVFFDNQTHIYAENGLLENIQAWLLGIACIVFLTAGLEKNSAKLILLFCALLCYAFLLRELDAEDFDVPRAIKFIGHGTGRNTTVAAAFLAIFLYAALNFSYYIKAAVGFAKSRAGRLLMTGGAFLVVGYFF